MFLLGSGISLPAHLPSVEDITITVLTGVFQGQVYCKHTDGRYYATAQIPCAPPQSELRLINTVYRRCGRYFRRGVTDEDVAYIIWQVLNEQSGNYENAALIPLLRQLRKCLPAASLTEVASDAYDYISSVVSSMLSQRAELGHLPLLIEIAHDSRIKGIEIFTLNHDTLIEQELQSANLAFSDGFDLQTPTCRYWVAPLTKPSDRRVTL
jgi:hypothetical protein